MKVKKYLPRLGVAAAAASAALISYNSWEAAREAHRDERAAICRDQMVEMLGFPVCEMSESERDRLDKYSNRRVAYAYMGMISLGGTIASGVSLLTVAFRKDQQPLTNPDQIDYNPANANIS